MAALSRAGLPLPYSREAIDPGLPGLAAEAAARAIVLALEGSEEPVRLIIDDYHRIASPATNRFLEYVIERMPDHAAIVGGFLTLAASEGTAERLADTAEQWRRCGAEVEQLGPTLDHYIESPRYVGGLLFKSGGTFDPRAYVTGLARQCEISGVSIFEQSPVRIVSRGGDGRWDVSTDQGAVRAATVVAAVHGGVGLGYGLDRLGYRIPCQLIASAR